MIRRLGLLTALLSVTAALIVPQSALAAPVRDNAASRQATVWQDPATHPVPHHIAMGIELVQPMASGGGCNSSYGGRACILYKGSDKALWANFYVGSWDHVDSAGTAYVYIEANGQTYYRYTCLTNFIGGYPISALAVGNSSGSAYTVVDFYDRNGSFINSSYSPLQWYP